MQRFIQTALAATALFGLSAAANAGPAKQTVQVEFNYDLRAPVAQTYQTALNTAEDACQIDGVSLMTAKRLAKPCIADLMDDFISRTGNAALADIHFQKTGREIVAERAYAATATPE